MDDPRTPGLGPAIAVCGLAAAAATLLLAGALVAARPASDAASVAKSTVIAPLHMARPQHTSTAAAEGLHFTTIGAAKSR